MCIKIFIIKKSHRCFNSSFGPYIFKPAVHLTLRMLRSIRVTNQKIEFYKLTNQKMFRSIRSAR